MKSDASSPGQARGWAASGLDCRAALAARFSRDPLMAIGVCFGAGYVAGRLPLPRILATAAGAVLHFAPHGLILLGVLKAREWLRNDELRVDRAAAGQEIQNQLLGEELAAVESYAHAITRFIDDDDRRTLVAIRASHEANSRRIRDSIVAAGGAPLLRKTHWRGLERALGGEGGRLSGSEAQAILSAGERRIVGVMEEVLADYPLPVACREMIKDELLPPARRNLESISNLREPS